MAGGAAADSLVVPSPAPRTGPITATWRLDRPLDTPTELRVEWTDGAGRLVMRRMVDVPAGHTTIPITIDLRRAVVMANRLDARLSPGGVAVAADFVAAPDASWPGYPVISWHEQTPSRAAGLSRLGVTAGKLFGTRDGPLSADMVLRAASPLVAADWRFYVENIATDFYSAYHRWRPDRPVTWAFDQARAAFAKNPADPAAVRREPSLSDEAALNLVRTRLAEHVRRFAPYRPLYYSLGDETGIADLAAAWDFDFSAPSLSAFRGWLRERYDSLAALNAQWNKTFADWDAVLPMTTGEAIRAPERNFSAWADFKDFMDEAFARAVRAGTDAVHAADPAARAGIEGAQIPGWGGYDYARLAHAVDVMEIYEAGGNVEIARSLNPALAVLTTTFPAEGDAEPARLWRALLRGNRGLIIWDEAGALVDDSSNPTRIGMKYGALFREFGDGLAAQLAAATPAADPVAILYSPASFRLAWLLDRRADGLDWTARNSEIEAQDSPLRAAVRTAAGRLARSGLSPRWVTDDILGQGILRSGLHALLLPHAIALSDEAVAAIEAFAADGGTVLADIPPGRFDAHGRSRPAPPLDGVARLVAEWPVDPVPPPFILAPDQDLDARVLRDGAVSLVGLQRASGAAETVLTLPAPAHIYDVRAHRDLGRTDRLRVTVGSAEPRLLALSPAPLPALTLVGPATAIAGEDVTLRIANAGSLAAARVVHIDALDPAGRKIAIYGGNVTLRDAPESWRIPLALNDPSGVWTIRAADRLGDAVAVLKIEVKSGQGAALDPPGP